MRLVLTVVVISYFMISLLASQMASNKVMLLLTYFCAFAVWSTLLLLAIRRWPGVYHWRRAITMFNDYAGITFSLVVGGEPALPVYAILLWVTVGNGLRYGSLYLRAATACAIISLALTTALTPFWREQPYLVTTLLVTAIIVPAYAHLLLTTTRKASEAALQANRDKSRLLAQASHDLRQPVHAISLFTACLTSSNLDTEQKQLVGSIDRSLQSVAQLFRSLLDISTLDSGKVAPRHRVIRLGDLLNDVVLRNSVAARWANVDVRLVSTRLCVRTDPELLTTMVQNIVSNAVKYAPDSALLIGCRRHGSSVSLEVHDRGRGISREHIDRVFDEFYRVREKRDRDIEGVGLGLSIVKRLADVLGLRVEVNSRPKVGTTFSIVGLTVANCSTVVARRPPGRNLSLLDGLRVLLVEDDEEVLLATAQLLGKWGCVVQCESTVPSNAPACDLVITDFDLNEQFNGADCIARVREAAQRPIPALVMTGHDIKRVRDALADPAIPILAKPFRPAELRAAIVSQQLALGHQVAET